MKMEPEKSNTLTKISKDTIWLFSVQILTSLTPLITLPALTKAYSIELYGAWVQIGVTSSLLSIVIGFYLGAALVRFLPSQDPLIRRSTFTNLLLPIIILGCIVIITGTLFRYELSILIFNNQNYTPLVLPILVSATIDALISYAMSYFQAVRDVKKYSILFVIMSVLQVFITVILANLGIDLVWLYISIIVIRFISLIVVFSQIGLIIGRNALSTDIMRKYFSYCFPLITSGLIYIAGISSSKYIITHLVSLSEAGIYSVSANIGNLLAFFIAPLSFIVFPVLVKFWITNDVTRVRIYLEYSIELFLFITIPAAAGLFILSQYLITILANSSYEAGALLVLLISVGTIFSGIYIASAGILQLNNQTKWIPLMVFISSSILIIGNILLIPLLGITGSGVAHALSYFILAAITTIYAVKLIHFRINFYFIIKIIISTAIMMLTLSLIKINSMISMTVAILIGVTIYSIGILLLKSFSKRDLQLFKELLIDLLNIKLSS